MTSIWYLIVKTTNGVRNTGLNQGNARKLNYASTPMNYFNELMSMMIGMPNNWLTRFHRASGQDAFWMYIEIFFILLIPIIIFSSLLNRRKTQKIISAWISWPTLEEYFRQNKKSNTEQGVRCHHCNSRSFKNHRFAGTNLRVVRCNVCNNILYRVS